MATFALRLPSSSNMLKPQSSYPSWESLWQCCQQTHSCYVSQSTPATCNHLPYLSHSYDLCLPPPPPPPSSSSQTCHATSHLFLCPPGPDTPTSLPQTHLLANTNIHLQIRPKYHLLSWLLEGEEDSMLPHAPPGFLSYPPPHLMYL